MAAAEIALAGMDPLKFLKGRDLFLRGIQQSVAQAVATLQRDRDLDRAKMIASEVGRMLNAATSKKG